MFLIDRINLEKELERKASYLRKLAERMEVKITELDVELKVWTMEEITKLNHRLLSDKIQADVENPAILFQGAPSSLISPGKQELAIAKIHSQSKESAEPTARV